MIIQNKIKLLIAIFIVACQQVNAQQAQKTLRVLLIGNSFSQNATRFLPDLAKEANVKLILGRAEMPGCSMKRHWDSVLVNNVDTNKGKAYNKKSLRQLLASQQWDMVTMQQASILSGDEETYRPYAKLIFDLIKSYQPKAQILIHQTWAYRSDALAWGKVKGEQKAKDQVQMWQRSRAAYHSIAKALGNLHLIPSGDAFHLAAIDEKWMFKKDPNFDYANPVFPNLPVQTGSINVGYSYTKDNKLQFDPNHANDAGCYLGGLVWYGILFQENPEKVIFKPKSVTDEFGAFLRQTASKAVKSM